MRQDSGRNRQGSVKILAETAKILINFFTYTSARNLVECGGLRAARRNARFLLRKVFAMILEISLLHATTPGGVRRILFAKAKTAALH